MIFYDSPILEPLKIFFTNIMILLLSIHLILIITLLFLCRTYLKELIKKISKKDVVYTLAVSILTTLTLMYLLKTSKICIENVSAWGYHLEKAKTMLRTGKYQTNDFGLGGLDANKTCKNYEFPSRTEGIPFIYFLGVLLLGTNIYINILLNFIFTLLTVLAIYFLILILTKNREIAFSTSFAALLSTLFVFQMVYQEVTIAAFFIILSILFSVLAIRINKFRFYLLTFLIISFGMKMRPENSILPLIFFIVILIIKKELFKNKSFIKWISVSLLVCLSFSFFNLIHVLFIPRFWGIEFLGPEYVGKHPFSWNNLYTNMEIQSTYFLEQGFLFIGLVFIGTIYSFLRYRKLLMIMVLSLLPYILIYLFYTVTTERYTYMFNIMTILIAGMGIYWIYSQLLKLVGKGMKIPLMIIFFGILLSLMFYVYILHKEICTPRMIGLLQSIKNISSDFNPNDLIITGRDDFVGIFQYSTDACIAVTAFTTDGVVIEEYKEIKWEKLKNYMEETNKRTFYLMPKNFTPTHEYYIKQKKILDKNFNLELVSENNFFEVHSIKKK